MPRASARCEGCGRQFKPSGLNSHLRQTRNGPCIALYEAQQRYHPTSKPPDRPPSSPPSRCSSPRTRSEHSFAGDFFGATYSEEDFGWHEDNEDNSVPEREAFPIDSQDEDTSGESDFEDLFLDPVVDNPYPQERPHDHDSDTSVESDTNIESEDEAPLPTRSQRQAAECSTAIRIPYVTTFADLYPGTKAGQPSGRVQHMRRDYATTLAEPDNPWVPFKSRMDWEIARWAKNRGPSSTAFDELLQIKGVSAAVTFSCSSPDTPARSVNASVFHMAPRAS